MLNIHRGKKSSQNRLDPVPEQRLPGSGEDLEGNNDGRGLEDLPVKPPRIALTEKVHHALSQHLMPGDIALDATAGNGHDTLFLARSVGQTGHVYAFDNQPQAIAKTGQRLRDAGLFERVTLVHGGHETMVSHFPPSLHGSMAAIVFNLGYLPGADKRLATCADNTLQALKGATQLLRVGGCISVLAYPGHVGGREETEAVKAWTAQLPDSFDARIHILPQAKPNDPEWIELILTGPTSN